MNTRKGRTTEKQHGARTYSKLLTRTSGRISRKPINEKSGFWKILPEALFRNLEYNERL